MKIGKSFPGPSLVTFLNQMNPAHVFAYFMLKNHFSIVLQFTPRSSKLSVFFMLCNQNLCNSFKPHAFRLLPLDLITQIINCVGVQFTRYLAVQFSSFSCYFLRSAFKMSSPQPCSRAESDTPVQQQATLEPRYFNLYICTYQRRSQKSF